MPDAPNYILPDIDGGMNAVGHMQCKGCPNNGSLEK